MTGHSGRGVRILIVDDEPIITKTLASILQMEAYETAIAFTGMEAVEIAKTFYPEILLTDMAMPGMNGIDAARIIREFLPDCQIVLFSGQSAALDLSERVRKQGLPMDVLLKPLAPDDLIQALSKCAARTPSRQQKLVLNVDDNPVQRYAVTRMLQQAGFAVQEAGTAAEAKKKTAALPDVILMDVHLPDAIGFDLCRDLKREPKTASVPVVCITNTAKTEQARQEALKAGAVDLVLHPVDPDALSTLLHKLTAAASSRS